MNNLVSKFKITEKDKFSLKDYDPGYADGFEKSEAKEVLAKLIKDNRC
jgi:hypothetical protein